MNSNYNSSGSNNSDRPKDQYWATLSDPEDIVSQCTSRIREYKDYNRDSKLIGRVIRNLRYYHGNFWAQNFAGSSTENVSLGAEGEKTGMAVNYFRNLTRHLLTIITQNPPSFQPQAVNDDDKSLAEARLANDILEYYRVNRNLETLFENCVEDSLIYGRGFVRCVWNHASGEQYDVAPVTNEEGEIISQAPLFSGDIEFSVPNMFDVVHDISNVEWEDNLWVLVRTAKNKWDIAERYPEVRDEILGWNQELGDSWMYPTLGPKRQDTDQIWVWEFYHKKCEACPNGRMLKFTGETLLPGTDTLESGGEMLYDQLPVYEMLQARSLLSPHGYTPAFDGQGMQEALNGEYSTILSNHENFGETRFWTNSNDDVDAEDLSEGFTLIKSNQKPELLEALSTAPEMFRFPEMLQSAMQVVFGVNSVIQGQPDNSLRSGSALALVQAQAVQFSGPAISSYHRLRSNVGSAIIRNINMFPQEDMVFQLVGQANRSYQRNIGSGDLDLIQRVMVKMGSPYTHMTAGREAVAMALMEKGLINTPEEYFNVLESGRNQPMWEGEIAQLTVIRQENEAMRNGSIVDKPLSTDNQVLHIREHSAVLNSLESRADQNILMSVLPHIMQHMDLMREPLTPTLQMLLGYGGAGMTPPPAGNMGGVDGSPPTQAQGIVNSASAPPSARPPSQPSQPKESPAS